VTVQRWYNNIKGQLDAIVIIINNKIIIVTSSWLSILFYQIQIHYSLLECEAVLFGTHTNDSEERAASRRLGQQVLLKRRYSSTKPDGITSQQTWSAPTFLRNLTVSDVSHFRRRHCVHIPHATSTACWSVLSLVHTNVIFSYENKNITDELLW